MNIQFNEINRAAQRMMGIDAKSRNRALAAGVALAIAATLPIPSTPVVNYESYYTLQVATLINSPISQIGESTVLDMRQCVEYTRAFWMLRYHAAHPELQLLAGSGLGFVDTVVGAHLCLSADDHAFFNEAKADIYAIASLTKRLLDEQVTLEATNGV